MEDLEEDIENLIPPRGGGGETAPRTTPFAWRAPFLEDFSRRRVALRPRFPFNVRFTGKTFD